MPTIISGTNGVDNIAPNTVLQEDLTTAVLPLGVGQTYQNVTAQRAIGTTYTNNTGRPMQVVITYASTSGSAFLNVSINGATAVSVGLSPNTANAGSSGSFIVPAGATYQVSVTPGTPTLFTWVELRT